MADVIWNDRQQQAISARNTSVIVSAAAGSGKTAVLVQRLLEILSDEKNPVPADRIAVVTFTNDAAAQMKQRLSEALTAAIEKDPLNSWLCRQQSLINSAKISTIHTFCFDMIKDNTKDLFVSSGFRILDEADESIIISNAADAVFEKLYSDSRTAPMMNRLVDFFSVSERKDSNLEDVLLKIHDFLMSVPFPEDRLTAAAENYTETDPFANAYSREFFEYTLSQLKFCLKQQKHAMSDVKRLTEENPKLGKLASVSGALSDIILTAEQLENAVETMENTALDWNGRIRISVTSPGRKRSYAKSHEFTAANDLHRRSLDNAIQLADGINTFTEENIRRDFGILKDIINGLALMEKMLNEEITAIKTEKNALGFSDAEQLAIKLLCTKDENGKYVRTPLAQQLSEHYKLIMIDEFQDANENQDLIFRLLSHNGTAEKNGDNLFVVGDVKQSIYGFRLADPTIFRNAFKAADSYSDSYDGTNARIVFSRNYRSSRDVIDFTNFVFEMLMTEEVGGVDYGEDERLVMGASYPEKDRSVNFIISDYSKNDTTLSIDEAEAETVAEKICSMLGKAEVSDGKTVRRCTPRDFCILIRDNMRGQLYADALRKRQVDAVCEETSCYLEAREIAVLLNFLRIIDNPLYDIPMVSVLMSPVFMLTADETAQLRLMSQNSIYSCILAFLEAPPSAENAELRRKLEYFTETLSRLRICSASMSMEKLIRTLYDSTDFLSSVQVYDDGIQKRANLRQLLVYARNYEENYDGGLSGFIRYIDDISSKGKDLKRASVNTSSDTVAVKTIHKSKGLEYPFIFLCGTSKGFNTKDEKDICLLSNAMGVSFTIQNHESLYKYEPVSYSLMRLSSHRSLLSEELRLLYVALTRAKEQLFISMMNETGSKGTTILSSRARLFSQMIAAEGEITPDIVSQASSMRDWLIMAFAVHPAFKEYADENGIIPPPAVSSEARITVCRNGIVQQSVSSDTEEELHSFSEETVQLLLSRFAQADESVSAETAAKLTITEIAKSNEELTLNLPDFTQRYSGLTAAQAGTAMHTFMQYADFEKAENGTDAVQLEADRLTELGILSEAERNSLDTDRLFAFFSSDIYLRMKKSDEICREKKFLVKISELSLDDELGEEYNNNNSMLQGIADCFFVENGEIVLIDYKTDRVTSEAVLADRYRMQLKLYSAAFEKLRGQRVKEAYLYSFSLGRKVPIPLNQERTV